MKLPIWFNSTNVIIVGIVIILVMQGFAISDQRSLIYQIDTETKKRSQMATEERQTQLDLSESIVGLVEQNGETVVPLVLDIDEDIEQLKTNHNISNISPDDKIKIELNSTDLEDGTIVVNVSDFIHTNSSVGNTTS
jgi:hypothetical protein